MSPRKKIILKLAGLFLFLVALFGVLVFAKAQFIFSNVAVQKTKQVNTHKVSLFDSLPQDQALQTNLLLLGIRGEDSPYGGLLTDTIMVASYDERQDKVAIISIPRDLYVRLPGTTKKEKINYAYVYGLEQGGVSKGMDYAKRVAARVTGLYIDYAVVAQMDALKEIVDTLGGIDIYLDRPFLENKQWYCDKEGKNCWEFYLPQGTKHLNGTTTLFYIRSRFSSSDFDRARRQQQVLLALKEKVFSLNLLSSPMQVMNLLDLVRDSIRTDMEQSTMFAFLKKARNEWDIEKIKTTVLHAGPDQPLKDEVRKERYLIVPRKEDWSEVHKLVENLLDDM